MFYLGMARGLIIGLVLSFMFVAVVLACFLTRRPKQSVEIKVGGETALQKEIEKP